MTVVGRMVATATKFVMTLMVVRVSVVIALRTVHSNTLGSIEKHIIVTLFTYLII